MWRLEFVRWEWMWDSTNNCSLQFPLSLQKPSQNLLSVAISKESPSSAVPTSVHLYHCPALTALLKLCMETVTSHASKCNSIFLLLVLKQIKLMIFHLHHFAIFFLSDTAPPPGRASFSELFWFSAAKPRKFRSDLKIFQRLRDSEDICVPDTSTRSPRNCRQFSPLPQPSQRPLLLLQAGGTCLHC